MIFVDAWAWIALAKEDDQYHAIAVQQHRRLKKKLRRYVTTDFVLSEVITYLYGHQPPGEAQQFVGGVLKLCSSRVHQLIHVTPV